MLDSIGLAILGKLIVGPAMLHQALYYMSNSQYIQMYKKIMCGINYQLNL